MKRFVKSVAEVTRTYPKILLIALFWMGILFGIIGFISEIVGIQVSDELEQAVFWQYLITTCGLAVVNAIENNRTVIKAEKVTVIMPKESEGK